MKERSTSDETFRVQKPKSSAQNRDHFSKTEKLNTAPKESNIKKFKPESPRFERTAEVETLFEQLLPPKSVDMIEGLPHIIKNTYAFFFVGVVTGSDCILLDQQAHPKKSNTKWIVAEQEMANKRWAQMVLRVRQPDIIGLLVLLTCFLGLLNQTFTAVTRLQTSLERDKFVTPRRSAETSTVNPLQSRTGCADASEVPKTYQLRVSLLGATGLH
eukprot:6480957-Amphidinium_carterae.1